MKKRKSPSIIRWLGVAMSILAFPSVGSAVDNNQALFYGQPGSYILNGAEEKYGDTDGEFTIQQVGESTFINFSGGVGDWWHLLIAPAPGEDLHEGLYLDARRFSSSGHPQLDLGYQGRSCDNVEGWFRVRHINRDPMSGSIVGISVDFEHHCEGYSNAVMGQLRIGMPDDEIDENFASFSIYFATESGNLPGSQDEVWYRSPPTELTTIDLQETEVAFASTTADGEDWTFRFGSGSSAALELGEYAGTKVPTDPTPDRPRLEVVRSDQVCDAGDGWFEILEIGTDDLGAMFHFAATFEFFCGNDPEPLYGQIRYDSPEPATPSRVPALVLAGGDWVASGQDWVFTDADSYFSNADWYPDEVYVWVGRNGGDGAYLTAGFAGPDGVPLAPGYYPDAERLLSASAGHPGMAVSMNHHGCNIISGEFFVYEISYDGNGSATSYAVDFVQYCEGTPPPMVGELRYRSDVPTSRIFVSDFEHGHTRYWDLTVSD